MAVLSQHFSLNSFGRDFFVGDIHGCFYLLEEAMQRVGFDAHCDRIFSVGDLIDRGEFSERVIDWLQQPFFHAVRGNHEQTLLDAYRGKVDEDYHRMLGGDWWYDLGLSAREQEKMVEAMAQLPLMLSVDTPHGLVGVVHAEVWGYDWTRALRALSEPNMAFYEQVFASSLWRRSKIAHTDRALVAGVDVVAVGHTPVHAVGALGNVAYLDTGIGYSEFEQEVQLSTAEALFTLVGEEINWLRGR